MASRAVTRGKSKKAICTVHVYVAALHSASNRLLLADARQIGASLTRRRLVPPKGPVLAIVGAMMSAESVLAVLAVLDAADIEAVVDGGWGVDALLGAQRRSHDDLDLVVPLDAVPAVVGAL